MRKVRFIHTADIHLGSLLHLTGELPPVFDKIVRNATFKAFERICDAALGETVDFIVISGDLYDREARSVKASEFFARQCERLLGAGIPVYVIAGNHDPLSEQPDIISLPSNVYILSSDSPESHTVKDKEGIEIARVTGQSYARKSEAAKIHENYIVPDTSVWNIALLHTQLESGDFTYVPCTPGELIERKDIHYWALGHIHTCREINNSSPAVWYPGIPQGRDFGEEGSGGYLMVELNPDSGANVKFAPVSSVVWKRIEICIDADADKPVRNITELEDRIFNEGLELIKKYDTFDGIIVQWILTGKSHLYELFTQQGEETCRLLTDNLRDRLMQSSVFLWTDSISPRVERLVDLQELKKKMPVAGEVEKIVSMCGPNGEYADELRDCLGQVWEKAGDLEEINENRLQLDEDTVSQILKQAQQLILDSLSRIGSK
jgi:DNA repair protein SbcD/Mre11